jgi:hypothetical protein
MAGSFFDLSKRDQAGLLGKYSSKLKMQPFIIEKDIWVCWALNKLFSMPDRKDMAFKGGTSLSKVYKAIDRFSEDVDVTIDYREFFEATKGNESRSDLKKLGENLRAELSKYSSLKIKPYFESVLENEFKGKDWKVVLDETGEKLFIHYPSAVEGVNYVDSKVFLEFGARNITEPNKEHIVKSYIAEVSNEVSFPEGKITVLALLRTYWEKATLVHFEYHRTIAKTSAERLSRHWYDLYQLSGDLSLINSADSHEILDQVVRHKNEFFFQGFAKYEDCNSGKLRLIPKGDFQKLLTADFAEMIKAQMFYKDPPKFEVIVEHLQKVEDAINEYRKSNRQGKSAGK